MATPTTSNYEVILPIIYAAMTIAVAIIAWFIRDWMKKQEKAQERLSNSIDNLIETLVSFREFTFHEIDELKGRVNIVERDCNRNHPVK